jgi:hypothetical protein
LDSALAQGGWAILVMHEFCRDCSTMAVRQEVMAAILGWLKQHSADVQVRTVGQVVGGAVKPPVTPPAPDMHEALLKNTALQHAYTFGDDAEGTTQSGGNPECWSVAKYGSIAISHQRAFDPSIKRWVQHISVRRRASGDSKLVVTQDAGGCAPAVHVGRAYQMSARVKSSVPVRFVVFLLRDGVWDFFSASPWMSPQKAWRTASWTSPGLPKGSTRMSFGLAISEPGNVSTTDYRLKPAPFHLAAWAWGLGASVLVCGLLVTLTPYTRRLRARRPADGHPQWNGRD